MDHPQVGRKSQLSGQVKVLRGAVELRRNPCQYLKTKNEGYIFQSQFYKSSTFATKI